MKWLRGLGTLAVLLAIWEWSSEPTSVLLPPWSDILTVLWRDLVGGALVTDIGYSVLRVACGVLVAAGIAAVMGVVSWWFRSFPDYVKGVVEIVRPVPPIAWTPIAIMAFGIGNKPAVAIVAAGAFFPIWFGVLQGLREVKSLHLQAARSLGARGRLVFTDVVVPSALPYVVHGLRLGVGIAWFCVVAAEMMGASSGLGYGVQLSSLNLEIERLYAYILVIGLIGFVSNWLLEVLDRGLEVGRDG